MLISCGHACRECVWGAAKDKGQGRIHHYDAHASACRLLSLQRSPLLYVSIPTDNTACLHHDCIQMNILPCALTSAHDVCQQSIGTLHVDVLQYMM